jgi:hypothetical protein
MIFRVLNPRAGPDVVAQTLARATYPVPVGLLSSSSLIRQGGRGECGGVTAAGRHGDELKGVVDAFSGS